MLIFPVSRTFPGEFNFAELCSSAVARGKDLLHTLTGVSKSHIFVAKFTSCSVAHTGITGCAVAPALC